MHINVCQSLYDRQIEVQEAEDLLLELEHQKRLILGEVGAFVAHARKHQPHEQPRSDKGRN